MSARAGARPSGFEGGAERSQERADPAERDRAAWRSSASRESSPLSSSGPGGLRRPAQRVGEEIADLQRDGRVGRGRVGGEEHVVRGRLASEVGVEHLSYLVGGSRVGCAGARNNSCRAGSHFAMIVDRCQQERRTMRWFVDIGSFGKGVHNEVPEDRTARRRRDHGRRIARLPPRPRRPTPPRRRPRCPRAAAGEARGANRSSPRSLD